MQEHDIRESTYNRTYLICGCGSLGYLIVEQLRKEGCRFFIIDKDPERVQELREQKYDAYLHDMNEPEMPNIDKFDIAFLVSDNHEANCNAISTIKNSNPDVHLVARAFDPISKSILKEKGADLVLYPQQIVASTAIDHLHSFHAHNLSKKLYSLIENWEGKLGIIAHTNPDPDAIASAMALEEIALKANPELEVRIFYDGNIGHQENRALVNLLDVKMERIKPDLIAHCNHIAIVDSGGPGVNNGIIPKTKVEIVIDHHPVQHSNGSEPDFQDIRPKLGSCSTIFAEYMRELEIVPDERTATALLYGIRSDTKNFLRNVTPQDLEFSAYLLPYTDSDLFEKIMSPQFAHETIDIIGNSIRNRKTKNGYLFSNVGYVRNRDALPQAADLLINLEGISTALVYGICDDAIIMSGRNRDMRLHLGNVMSEAFDKMGKAGGHGTMAAAMIPLNVFSHVKEKEELLDLIIEPILQNFYKLVGLLEDENGEF